MANDSRYGLSTGIFTESLRQRNRNLLDKLKAGDFGSRLGTNIAHGPDALRRAQRQWPSGEKAQSCAIEEMTEIKTVGDS